MTAMRIRIRTFQDLGRKTIPVFAVSLFPHINKVAVRCQTCLLKLHNTMSNLTKRDLVMQISKETGITQQEVFAVIQQTLDLITDALASGQDVELRNFGVFEVRLTKSRVGRNPHKPETDVVIPARATVKFKSGKIMRQRVLLRTDELRAAPLKKKTKL
jgi:nucleoid DNA-binding protein